MRWAWGAWGGAGGVVGAVGAVGAVVGPVGAVGSGAPGEVRLMLHVVQHPQQLGVLLQKCCIFCNIISRHGTAALKMLHFVQHFTANRALCRKNAALSATL
ncbi:hypothetical protein J53TS2_09440 [Paenibacillus sp. J53TS2]|nr:hypothetical protein J53TS2_09440 [Paenibacillus sp. J53TS2]